MLYWDQLQLVSAFAFSITPLRAHTHKRPNYWLFSKGKFVSPFSLCCAAADSEDADFDPLRSPSSLTQEQKKGNGTPASQRLVPSSLFSFRATGRPAAF